MRLFPLQSGLSWTNILRKRCGARKVFLCPNRKTACGPGKAEAVPVLTGCHRGACAPPGTAGFHACPMKTLGGCGGVESSYAMRAKQPGAVAFDDNRPVSLRYAVAPISQYGIAGGSSCTDYVHL